MARRRTHALHGMTAVEISVGLMVLGVVAAVAVPIFARHAGRSRTAEAPITLDAIARAEITYYRRSADRPDTTGNLPPKQFLATDPCPEGAPTPARRPGNWNAGAWPYLEYTSDDPMFYTYQVNTTDTAGNATATVIAHGDLDGDGIQSTFLRTISVDPNGEPVAGPLRYQNELE